jgi:hypothetical protein
MDARLIAAAIVAGLTASCSGGLYDTSDFLSARAKGESAGSTAQTQGTGEAGSPTETQTETAASTDPATEAATEAAAAADSAANEAAEASTATAPVAAAAPPVQNGSAAVAATRGLLAFFRTPAPASPEAAGAAAAIETATPEPAIEEITEAELAGEVEADPDKIAVPEEPFNDGMAHDFVNVYTSRPDAAQPLHEGLPGVSWEGGIVLVSRTPDGDPSSLFGGDHPFARSVPGIPRQTIQAANGLLLAHSAINVSCVKSNLLGLVRRAENHFGKKVVITSGYRSPAHNRRVRGATHSQHMYCNALDLYMPGVARDDLARFFFAQADRGGIGLYCHTRSIHVDTGKRRQWRWSCKRRRS